MVDKRLEIDIVANDRASRPIKNLQSTIIRFVGAVSASLAALQAIIFPVNSGRQFERVLRDIQKTTGFVNEEIDILGQQLLDLSRIVDTPANDLGRIAAAAGQLGLGEEGGEAILQFTESIARASTTLDLTATQAATSFAKIGSIFNIPIENTENLISTINELSNTTTATADQLLDVVRRVGTVAGSFEGVAALAAQAIQLGLSPETAGTSLVKIFSNFESRADQFAEAFGITVGDFLGRGAIERWEFYLGELAKLSDEEAAKLINTLSGSGRIFALVDKQVQDAKNGFDIFRQAQEDARTSFEEGTSAIKEYENIAQSLDVQLRILGNNFAALGTEIGLRLIPTLVESVKQLQEFLQTERARLFFEQLGGALVSVVNLFEGFVNVITSLPAGLLSNIFDLAALAALVQAFRFAFGFIIGGIERLVLVLTGLGGAVSGSLGRVTAVLGTVVRTLTTGTSQATAAVNGLSAAVAEQSGVFAGATAQLGRYVDATQTATVTNAGLAKSAQQAQAASLRGAGAVSATAIDLPAQQRITGLNEELQLISRKKAAQEEIIATSNKELANLKNRATILRRADRLTGNRNAISQRGLDILTQQANQQKAIIATANTRLGVLRSQFGVITKQLLVLKEIDAQVRATAVQSQIASNRRLANLTLLQRQVVAFQAGLAGAGTQATRLGGALTRVSNFAGVAARSLRVLAPVVRAATVAFRALWAAIGGPIGLAIAAILFFGDEIAALYRKITGTTTEAEAQLTEIVRLEARVRQGIIDQQIADFKRLEASIDAASRRTARSPIDVEVAEFQSGDAFEEQARFTSQAAQNLNDYSKAAAGAAQQVQTLTEQQDSLRESAVRLQAESAQAEDPLQSAALAERSIQAEEALGQLNSQIARTRALQNELAQGATVAAQELTQSFTQPLSAALDAQSAFVDAREELGELELQAKKLAVVGNELALKPEIDGEALDTVRTQLAAIFNDPTLRDATAETVAALASASITGLQNDITETRKEVSVLEKEASGLIDTLSFSDRQIADEFLEQGKAALDLLKEQRDLAGDILDIESERTRELRETAPEILAQKFAYDEVLEALDKTKEAAAENRKAADGIFDNTASEARALNQRLEETRRNLQDIIRLRVRERDLARDITQGQDSIADSNEQIADLREQLADSTDVYFRNVTRARIQELESKKNLEETLVFERQREQETLKFLDILEQLPGLTREARDAAAEGQVGPLQAIKDQIDTGIGDAEGILSEIANLTDAEGNFLFRPGEIREFEDALSSATDEYTDALPGINELLRDAATATEREIADQIKIFTEQNAKTIKAYEDLIKQFPGIADSIDVVRQAWEASNRPLIEAINNFGTGLQSSLLGGTGLPTDFGDQIADIQNDAGRAALRSIADSFGNSTLYSQAIDAGIAGANLEQYRTKVRESTALAGTEGVNEIQLDRNGRYYTNIKSVTQQAVEAALQDIEEGTLPTRQLAPSEQVRQQLEPIVSETDPTANTLARVQAQLTEGLTETTGTAVSAGLRSPEAVNAAEGLGNDISAGFFKGFETFGIPGAIVGIILGGLSEGLQALVEEAKKQLRIPGEPVRIPQRAGGGPIGGVGTGTSDSNLIWASKGEYVSDAKTAGFFGEGFFAFLKRIARGHTTTTDRLQRGIPRFAGGGLVGSGSSLAPVNLNIPGLGSFPMAAETSTIDQVSNAIRREKLKKGRRRL